MRHLDSNAWEVGARTTFTYRSTFASPLFVMGSAQTEFAMDVADFGVTGGVLATMDDARVGLFVSLRNFG